MMTAKRTAQGRSRGPGGRRAASGEAETRQRAIGERLKKLFDPVVDEPVPEEFLKLLEQADETSKEGDGGDET